MATVPHKNAEIIKAWVDGAEVQYFSITTSEWTPIPSISSGEKLLHIFDSKDLKFRIKPKEVVDYTIVSSLGTPGASFFKDIQTVAENYAAWPTSSGVLERTTVDGKVVSFKFIPRN